MVSLGTIALPRRDIDGIDPVGILRCSQCGLRICRVYRGRSRENGGEKTCVPCRSHLLVPSLGLMPLMQITRIDRNCDRSGWTLQGTAPSQIAGFCIAANA